MRWMAYRTGQVRTQDGDGDSAGYGTSAVTTTPPSSSTQGDPAITDQLPPELQWL
jgi:hypothetical protein